MFDVAGMLRAQGIDLKGTAAELAAVRSDLRAIRATLEAAHGVPAADTPPAVASRVPLVVIVEFGEVAGVTTLGALSGGSRVLTYTPDDGVSHRVEIERATGRPSSRGFVANIGANPVLVRFLGTRDEWTAFAELPAGSTLDYSWDTRTLELLSINGQAAKAQVFAL